MSKNSVVWKFRTAAADDKSYAVQHYNLDVIISVGYRIKSQQGTQFRIWATNILKEFITFLGMISYLRDDPLMVWGWRIKTVKSTGCLFKRFPIIAAYIKFIIENALLQWLEKRGEKRSRDSFAAEVSQVRNPVIAQVFHRLEIMECWGSGWQRISEACEAGGYPKPEWQELGTCTRVIFRPHPEVRKNVPINVPINVPVNVPEVNERQQWFYKQLVAGKNVKASDIAAYWNVTEKTAKRDIATLREKKLIEFVGAPKTGRYQLKEHS